MNIFAFYLLIIFVVFPVYAGPPDCQNYVPPETTLKVSGYCIGTYCASTPASACDFKASACPSGGRTNTGTAYNSGTQCVFTYSSELSGCGLGGGIFPMQYCPSGYTQNGDICQLTNSSIVYCPTCGQSSGYSYSPYYSQDVCNVPGDIPEQCPGLEIHDPITGHCFTPPTCLPPQALSGDGHSCTSPSCPSGFGYSEPLKRCVAQPPTCGPNQHLVGNSQSSFAPYCEDNPVCPSGQNYGCAAGSCGCFGPQDCGANASWGQVNGVYGCYGNTLNPKNPITPPYNPSPKTPTAPIGGPQPTGGLPTPTGLPPVGSPGYVPSGGGGSGGGGSGGGGSGGGGSGGGTISGSGFGTPFGQPGSEPGVCTTGDCLCPPGAHGVGMDCPLSGQCPKGYYTQPDGSCSKNKGDCESGKHFEFSSHMCVPDVNTAAGEQGKQINPENQDTKAITDRLDVLVDNTKKADAVIDPDYKARTSSITDEINSGLNTAKTTFNANNLGSNPLTSLFPSSPSCMSLSLTLPHGLGAYEFNPCPYTDIIRQALGYFLYVMLTYRLYEMLTET